MKGSSDLTLLDPGGDPFHIAIAVFFSRKRVFYYLTFIILGLDSFSESFLIDFYPDPPPRGVLKNEKKLKIGRRA